MVCYQLLDALVTVHRSMGDEDRDFAAELHCLQQLNRSTDAAAILRELAMGNFSHTY